MPKIQRSEEKIKSAYLTGVIRKYMDVQDTTVPKLAASLHISSAALYTKLREPWKFTYPELYAAFKILKIPADEVLQCFCVRREAS